METLFTYLLKLTCCSAILLGYYWLALRNERFHLWNRFFLLAVMLLSLVVPLFSLPVMVENDNRAMETVIGALPWNRITMQQNAWWSMENLLITGVVLVSITLLMRLLLSVHKIFLLYKNHDHVFINEISLVVTSEKTAPFSFFKWLFWRSDIDPDSENGKRMLEHELVHISEKHSADKLFAELILVIFWINPFFWIIRRELYAIHEFLADRKAIAGQDGGAFAEMILQAAYSGYTPALSNPFFNSQLKRRLIMITSSHAPKYSYIRRISGLMLMLLITMVMVLTIERAVAQKAPPPPPTAVYEAPPPPEKALNPLPDSIKSVTVIAHNDTCITVYKMKDGRTLKMKLTDVEKRGYPLPPPPPPAPAANHAAELPGSIIPVKPGIKIKDGRPLQVNDINNGENPMPEPVLPAIAPVPSKAARPVNPVLPAPKNEQKATPKLSTEQIPPGDKAPLIIYAGIEITAEQMNQVDPKNIASIDVLKDAPAIKAYGEKGKNGVIRITPKPTGKVTDTKINTEGNKVITVEGYKLSDNANPLYLIDGKIANEEKMQQLDPKLIEKMNVLKGEAAVKAYGKKGANGVVEITTKKMAL